jgi:hypothetical protein
LRYGRGTIRKEFQVRGVPFLLVAVIVGLIDVLVPYLVLAGTGSFRASFLFWCVITLAMIVFAAVYTRRWRDQ